MTVLPVIPVMRPALGEAEALAAADAVRSGWVAQGPRVAAFERAFADQVGADHAVAVSSCTTALQLALILQGLGPGDEVVVPSLSFIATTNAVRYVGATPVFADVEAQTGNLTAATIAAVLTPRTRAVILVHQGGMPADVDAVTALTAPRGIEVVQDAACAIGSTYRSRPVAAGAPVAAWSFHPRKLITTGEGGMLTLQAPQAAARARRLREHGMSVSAADRAASGSVVLEQYLEVGFNFRMTDIQAAVGLVQLGRLSALIAERRALASRYRELLGDLDEMFLPSDPPYGTSNFQSFVVRLGPDFPMARNDVLEWLGERGISARRGIMAAHLEPAWVDHPRVDLPVTEQLTHHSLILPLYCGLSTSDQDRVVSALRQAAGHAG
jgi:dTDP-4-amino-4,6-dideoxygalactose transaminase